MAREPQISIGEYVGTGGSKFSFSKGMTFSNIGDFSCQHYSWRRHFDHDKARHLVMFDNLWRYTTHQCMDLLFGAWTILAVGGTLRVIEPQRIRPDTPHFSLGELCERLSAVGFAVRPMRYVDARGQWAGDSRIDPAFGDFNRQSQAAGNTLAGADGQMIIDCVKYSDQPSRSAAFGRDSYFFVGDSHTRFPAGTEDRKLGNRWPLNILDVRDHAWMIRSAHLGPGLAFNLNKIGSTSKTREKIELLFDRKLVPTNARVVFSFGEIDIRAHVFRHVGNGTALDTVIDGLIAIYQKFLLAMKERAQPLGVWGAVAQCPWTEINERTPLIGTPAERNTATDLFNRRLREICEPLDVQFLSIFPELVDETGATRFQDYYRDRDPIHVTQVARKFLWQLIPGEARQP